MTKEQAAEEWCYRDMNGTAREYKAFLAGVEWREKNPSDAVKALVEALELIDTSERDLVMAPEDSYVKSLCDRIGYGAVIGSAARQWRKIDPIGALTSGPCVYIIKRVLANFKKEMGE